MNKFCFIVPVFNASKTITRMLHSVCGQSHSSWKIILIDDCSSLTESKAVHDAVVSFRHICENQIDLIINQEKKWEVANVLLGISLCDDADIICRLDADDFLSDLDALRILNLCYEQGHDCVWTAHRWFDDDVITQQNISSHLPQDANPYVHPWVSSHLKTFRKSLINEVNDLNFRGADGEYIKRAGDQAIYLPVLYRSKSRFYLPMCMYSYRCPMKPETFQSQDAKFQAHEAQFIRSRGYIS